MQKKSYPEKKVSHKKTVDLKQPSTCSNADCKLRKKGCTGFEGCPGYKGK